MVSTELKGVEQQRDNKESIVWTESRRKRRTTEKGYRERDYVKAQKQTQERTNR